MEVRRRGDKWKSGGVDINGSQEEGTKQQTSGCTHSQAHMIVIIIIIIVMSKMMRNPKNIPDWLQEGLTNLIPISKETIKQKTIDL